MTNVRLQLVGAEEWVFCPYCGRKTELDQSPDDIVRYSDGEINIEASEAAGFDFSSSIRHCDVHVRLWESDDGSEAVL